MKVIRRGNSHLHDFVYDHKTFDMMGSFFRGVFKLIKAEVILYITLAILSAVIYLIQLVF